MAFQAEVALSSLAQLRVLQSQPLLLDQNEGHGVIASGPGQVTAPPLESLDLSPLSDRKPQKSFKTEK